MFKSEGLGKLFVFARRKLWIIVCKAAKRNASLAIALEVRKDPFGRWIGAVGGQYGQLSLISQGATGQIC